jgi:hypothetical protein
MPRVPGRKEDAGMSNSPREIEHEAVAKLHELEHTAAVGESAETPLILIGEVWVVAATAVLIVLAITLIAYRLAS